MTKAGQKYWARRKHCDKFRHPKDVMKDLPKSKVVVNVGDASITNYISFAGMFDRFVLQPFYKRLKETGMTQETIDSILYDFAFMQCRDFRG